MDATTERDLYPHTQPYETGLLALESGAPNESDAPEHPQQMYFEVSGNPHGTPVVFLHGGPGAGATPTARRFFNPAKYRVILFDQRGAGKSTPRGSIANNTTDNLIADIEQLRRHLKVDSWLVFGGSWGATLGLAYGQAHPGRCLGFILRGIFLGSNAEISWFLHGMKAFNPAAWRDFAAHPGVDENNLLKSYACLLNDPEPNIHVPAARSWAHYENSCSTLHPIGVMPSGRAFDAYATPLARIEAHYFENSMYLTPDQLMKNIDKISHLPATIIQGRYDIICPPASAHRLARAWPGAVLEIINDAGHSAMEPGIRAALTRACDQFVLINSINKSDN